MNDVHRLKMVHDFATFSHGTLLEHLRPLTDIGQQAQDI